MRDAIYALFPAVESGAEQRALRDLVSNGAQFQVRDMVVADPSLIGQTISVWVPVADPIDQLHKGVIDRDLPPDRRRVSDREIAYFDALVEQGRIRSVFNTTLFTAADSRFPELAGLKGALVGSFYLLLICFLLSVPIGVSAAIYLEEFAPKNRWTDLIEININNLAAVPSIVFGLLGLAVFLGFFGLPRSAPLVGGMVLSLMTLPTIIIATRAAFKAVPPSIREAALGIGASRLQTVTHHVLPLAMPGILTGTIIGLAQALGETAPLLLIGMNAFITAAPDSMLAPSTALADADLHLVRQPGARLRRAHQRRDHRAARLPDPDERGRRLPAQEVRTEMVSEPHLAEARQRPPSYTANARGAPAERPSSDGSPRPRAAGAEPGRQRGRPR